PLQDLIDISGSAADRDARHRRTKSLHHAAAVAIDPGQFPHQGTEAGAIATDLLGRDVCLTPATTRLTPALMQHPVRHRHRGREVVVEFCLSRASRVSTRSWS